MEEATGHTSARMTGRIDVIGRVSGRRFWTVEQKLAILRDAFGPGGSVRVAIERHEVTSGLLYTWRRMAMSGLLFDRPTKMFPLPAPEPAPGFVEVRIADPAPPAPPLLPPSPPEASGRIGIELPSGVRISVDAAVDGDALARACPALSR